MRHPPRNSNLRPWSKLHRPPGFRPLDRIFPLALPRPMHPSSRAPGASHSVRPAPREAVATPCVACIPAELPSGPANTPAAPRGRSIRVRIRPNPPQRSTSCTKMTESSKVCRVYDTARVRKNSRPSTDGNRPTSSDIRMYLRSRAWVRSR